MINMKLLQMDLRTPVLVLMLCGITCNAQLFSGIEGCTSPKFLLNVTTCFIDKFSALLPFSDDDVSGAYGPAGGVGAGAFTGGRRLQAFGDKSSHDGAMRENIMNTMSEGFFADHKAFMDNLQMTLKLVAQREKETVIMERLRQSDFKGLFDKWMNGMLEHVSPIAMRGMYAAGASSFVDIPQIVCVPLNRFFGSQFCDCMEQYHEQDFEDGVRWLQCFYNCDDLPSIGACVDEQFATCDPTGKWAFGSSIVNKGFAQFTKLDDCFLKVEVPQTGGVRPQDEDPITLTEGDVAKEIKVSTYMTPGALCTDLSVLAGGVVGIIRDAVATLMGNPPDCHVTIEVSTGNYLHNLAPDMSGIGRPKCLGGRAMHQVMIGPHTWQDAEGGSGVIPITKDSWQDTHVLPIRAAVDYKRDGEVWTNITFKLNVQGRTVYNYKYNVTVLDTDPKNASICSLVNDPHITTFDGHYYNNHYEGFFYLYESTEPELPYEVQAIFQKCAPGAEATCTCAVAVRSGDDVFVVDRCRKTSGDTVMKTIMFVNGELSPGTRVYRQNGGMRFNVVLPHGMYVRIENSMDMLNVWITPSNYDESATQGLCGIYNEDPTDDLTFPNGTLYTGPGSEERGQPRPFSQAYRVPESSRIFRGALESGEQAVNMDYCGCNHMVMRGVRCDCGGLADTCNFGLDGEITQNISMIWRRSKTQIEALRGAATMDITTDDIDVDLDYEPPEFDWDPTASWNQTEAEKFCWDLLDSSQNAILQECIAKLGMDFLQTAVYQCEEDIMITDDTAYKYSALQSAKAKCWGEKAAYRDLLGFELPLPDMSERRPATYRNSSCLNECNGRGVCVEGECVCNNDYTGSDCSLASGHAPSVYQPTDLCDARYEACQWATIYGEYFPDDGKLMCHVRMVEMKDDGYFKNSGGEEPVPAVHISNNQIACELPEAASYRISLYYEADQVPMVTSSGPEVTSDADFVFISADSVCFTCDTKEQKCTLKQSDNYCYFEHTCSAPGQMKFNDTCLYCNNTANKDEWSWIDSEECDIRRKKESDDDAQYEKSQNIRIAVACSLSGLIVIITIILFFISKKNGLQEKHIELTPQESMDGGKKPASIEVEKEGEAGNHVYDNATMSTSDEAPTHTPAAAQSPPQAGHLPGTPTRNKRRERYDSERDVDSLMRVKQLAKESRLSKARTDSIGSTSVASIGIGGGGGGPGLYHHYMPSEEEVDAGLGGRGSPKPQHTMYDDIFINTMF